MFTMIFILAVLAGLLWLGFKVTGALLTAVLWIFICVPLALLVCMFGLLLCCTILLIPLGIRIMRAGFRMIFPGYWW